MAARTGVKDEAQLGATLLVIHNFAARSPDELSLAKGERIQLIERDDEFGDGWFLGRHLSNGRTGLFPEVYTALAPRPTLPTSITQQRGASESLVRSQSNHATPTQYRHSSASATTGRSESTASVDKASSMVHPSLRTSLPSASSIPRSEAMSTSSPVMHETLSVIDEHMNDMNPPSGYSSPRKRHSTGPSYAFIAGHETDDEENQVHTEEEVLTWSPDRVAEYLEDHGVEKSHCDVFKEQEISGEVLLAMDQSSLFLKEFALGSVGRRLKTWHKIRALQEEARQPKSPEVQRSASAYTDDGSLGVEPARSRASTVGSALPRALDTSRPSTGAPARSNTLQPTSYSESASAGDLSLPKDMVSTAGPEATWNSSVQSVREMQIQRRQSQRQSALDYGSAPSLGDMINREMHRKQPSLDQTWRPGQPQSNGQIAAHSHSLSSDAAYPSIPNRDSSLPSSPNRDETDKGYFSSIEVDSRSRTETTPATSKTSADIGGSEISRSSSFGNRRSTYSSGFVSPEPARDSVSPAISPGIFGALNSVGNTYDSTRSATSPSLSRQQQEKYIPVVTKLDHSDSSDALANLNNPSKADDSTARSNNSPKLPFLAAYKPKIAGLRTISDAITKHEKLTASPTKERDSGSPASTGSTSPSVDSKSIDMQKSDGQSRASAGSNTLVPPQANQRRTRVKPKKATSAYTRGLERKSPAEQMLSSDYSGWMKKKSGSLMTPWRTRLFVLRGRRLSYYYSDNDTEEKGLIDISFHRVLPAQNETLTTLHATMTGAIGSPTSPKESHTPTAAEQDLAAHPAVGETKDDGGGMFIFKLVPPKSGLSKGVNFTKPTVHYFAVNSRQEGRLWMAALMKATIDRDEDGRVITTYNQKTISLAKARARRERPPALMGSDDEKLQATEMDGTGDHTDSNSVATTGLGIGGLGGGEDSATGGAEGEKDSFLEDASSLAPSTAVTAGGGGVLLTS